MSLPRHLLAALRTLLVLTVVTGALYPLVVLGVAATMPNRANGSLLTHDGHVVGSSLLSQKTEGPQWFHPRPSAGDHDAANSGGSNLGQKDPGQLASIAERRRALGGGAVPGDGLTQSASGLDPHISPEYAMLQTPRVARARKLPLKSVQDLVRQHTQHPVLGFIGTERVNVLELNLALLTLRG